MKSITLITIIVAVVLGSQTIATNSDVPAELLTHLEKCSVVWELPSENEHGSMPIGNGDIGANVWVEPSGDLLFYISKTDAWDENMRLLKLGKVRVKLTPSLVQKDKPFIQKLDLAGGRILIRSADTEVTLWIDANNPVIQVDAKSLTGQPIAASAAFEVWRREKRPITGREYHSTGFTSLPAFSWPDTILPATPQRIGWYHRNVQSPWLASLKLQKLESLAKTGKDPLLNLTSGVILSGNNFEAASNTELKTRKPAQTLSLRIYPLTQITDSAEKWVAAVEKQERSINKMSDSERMKKHVGWWSSFWNRSWIFVDGGNKKSPLSVTRGYTLQRWINACGGRGAYPIKFNGSIFTVDGNDKGQWDADYRRWGGGYWWQNTRLPYWGMLETGDTDLMQPLFKMFMKSLPARKLATKTYYGHEGAFYPETQSFWGNYLDEADLGYGTNRKGKPDGLTDNGYIRRYWQGGIEMVAMMLDYYDITQDIAFRDKTLIPFATEILTFFDQHWKRGADCKILFHPAQSLETWWTATNPLPEIAGLRYVIPRMQKLTQSTKLKRSWQKTFDDLPSIPLNPDKTILLPAEKYATKRNIENTEMYAIFPYRHYGLTEGADRLAIGRATYAQRAHKGTGGWNQNAIKAALLGMTKDAQNYVTRNFSTKHGGSRFSAFWGPNYDWIPDQDHGAVAMLALQRMALQCEDRKIYLLPTWPATWDVDLKLHAKYQTTVELKVKEGKLIHLRVTPESRRKDVILPSFLQSGTKK